MSGLTTKLPPTLQVPVADTVGCGDSFAAAIILGFIRGHSIPETLALANAGEALKQVPAPCLSILAEQPIWHVYLLCGAQASGSAGYRHTLAH